jgi:uncharacterized protein (TIGR02996 family)
VSKPKLPHLLRDPVGFVWEDFLREIEDRPTDNALKCLFADWLEERGEDDLAFAFRWCAFHDKHPTLTDITSAWVWVSFSSSDKNRARCRAVLPKYMSHVHYRGEGKSILSPFLVLAEFWAEVRKLEKIG